MAINNTEKEIGDWSEGEKEGGLALEQKQGNSRNFKADALQDKQRAILSKFDLLSLFHPVLLHNALESFT